ncbi:uncharacterized protein LOC34619111 [Cyclospora cayetanensis]|uniref:Uncharacterized protein LOC34619111 n=1 Tax=Cyclospora cayetanensis TaxID=88456 RepID=A0A6P6RZA7_9EIME|nr:uncharacterized protein LOC34619111 [Cyclospora cayetanensis]
MELVLRLFVFASAVLFSASHPRQHHFGVIRIAFIAVDSLFPLLASGEAAHSSPLIARHGPSTASPAEGQSGSETQQQASEHASAPQATQTVIELTATNRYHSSSHEASSPPIRGGDQHSLTALLNDLRHHGTQMTLKERRNAEAILRAKYGAITQQLLQQDDQ